MSDIIKSASNTPLSAYEAKGVSRTEEVSIGNLDSVPVEEVKTDLVTCEHINTFAQELKDKYGEGITNWAFPTSDQKEAFDDKMTLTAFETLKKMVLMNTELARYYKLSGSPAKQPEAIEKITSTRSSISQMVSDITTYIMDAIYPPEGVIMGGLTNGANNCFINSALQLVKAIPRENFRNQELLRKMPTFQKFLDNKLASHNDCLKLRSEIAEHILADAPGECSTAIIDGCAEKQQDASEFLEILLKKLEVPKTIREKTQTNPKTGETRKTHKNATTEDDASEVFPLRLPEFLPSSSEQRPLTMQTVVNHSLESDLEMQWDGVNNIWIKEKTSFGDPIPESLVLSVGRFDIFKYQELDGSTVFHQFKRLDTIDDILRPISLPKEDGTAVIYEPTAIICHDGPSTSSGHYVSFRKEAGEWRLYNDANEITELGQDPYYNEDFIKKNCYVISYQKISETADETDVGEGFSGV